MTAAKAGTLAKTLGIFPRTKMSPDGVLTEVVYRWDHSFPGITYFHSAAAYGIAHGVNTGRLPGDKALWFRRLSAYQTAALVERLAKRIEAGGNASTGAAYRAFRVELGLTEYPGM